MSRARNIKPGLFKNEELSECSALARLLFIGLWCEADREGRLEDRPKRIKATLLPYDECDVDRMLWELSARGFIVRYEVAGVRYIAIPAFTKHQNPHKKEPASVLPSPPEPGRDREIPGQNREFPGQDREIPEPTRLIPDSLLLIPDSGFLITSSYEEGGIATDVAPPPQRKRFVPPTVEEVEAHCRETGRYIDAQAFVDFYASKGWVVGKAPMKSWQAAVGTWARRDRGQVNGSPAHPSSTRARSLADDLTDRSWV